MFVGGDDSIGEEVLYMLVGCGKWRQWDVGNEDKMD